MLLVFFTLAFLTFSVPSFAQSAAVTSAGAVVSSKVKIYFPGFSDSAEHVSGGPADLKSFVNTYLYLRLSQISNALITNEVPDPGCAVEQNSVRRVIPQQAPPPRTPELLSFYTVRGNLEVRLRDSSAPATAADDVVINYELLKTVRCAPQVLLRRSEPIPQSRLLDSISVVADAVAFRVGEDAATRIGIDLKTVSADKPSPEEAEFAGALTDHLIHVLATSDDLQPRDANKGESGGAAGYVLESHVTFPRSPSPFRGFARSVEVSLYLVATGQISPTGSGARVGPQRYTLTPTPLRYPPAQRAQLFAAAADTAIKGINDVRYTREAGLPENYSAAQALARAKQLLCDGSPEASCVPQTDAAISLLRKEPPSPDNWEWLAKAQYLSGRYADAADSFSSSLRSAPSLPLEAALRLNVAAGDAWYQAQSFANAAASYDAAAKIAEENPGVHSETDFNLRRALSHRFKGDRLGAIDALINPLRPVASPESLELELEHIVAVLLPNELPEAIARLERSPSAKTDQAALVLAYQSKASAQINEERYAEAQETLRKALPLADPRSLPTLNYLVILAQYLTSQSQNTGGDKTAEYRAFSERLDPILKEDPVASSYGPLALQLLLCVDYIEDHTCVRRTIEYLDKSKAAALPSSIELDLAEIQVLDKDRNAALERLDRVLKVKDLEPRLRMVASFYRVWLALAEGKPNQAEQWFRDWQEALKRMRKSGSVAEWTFGAATRALQNANESFSAGNRSLLFAMMQAMEDDKAQIPTFHQ
jgi:tetratricopeptide (TPR) repeat protein